MLFCWFAPEHLLMLSAKDVLKKYFFMYMSVLDGYDDRTTLKNNVCYIIRDRQGDNPLIKTNPLFIHGWPLICHNKLKTIPLKLHRCGQAFLQNNFMSF